MQSDQRQGNSSSSRRRRRRVEVCSQLLLPVVAAAGMCLSGSHLVADAFVAPSTPPITWSPRNSLRLSSEAATPPLSIDSVYGRQRSMSMVIRESPSAACRRALQRAWQATPSEATSHETSLPQTSDALQERGLDVRLTTFNLLAPCYKRIPSAVAPIPAGTGLLASQASSHHTARESEFAGLWRERAMETVEFIQRDMLSSDIICLQEFWFDPSYETIFRSALGDEYDFHTLKRTGGKSDGVAVLLRRGKWHMRSSMGMSLSPVGDRVALVMHLRSQDGGGASSGVEEDMILVNTHLAFPHTTFDRANQLSQIEMVTDSVEGFVRNAGLPTMTPRVVVGDLNVEETDPVCRHLGKSGFRSAFASLHREQRVITHRNHRGEEVMVDHVFVKAPGFAGRKRGEASLAGAEVPKLVARLHEDVKVEEALLLPTAVDTAAWSPRFRLSDHRPLSVRLKFPVD